MHAGIGVHSVAKEAARAGVLHRVVVVGVRLLGARGQVDAAAAEAAGGIEQVPAVEAELEMIPKGAEGGVLPPGLK